MVTSEPGSTSDPPAGSWSVTNPSRHGSSVSTSCVFALNPASWSWAVADSSSWLVTSGTDTVAGPLETCRVTVEPRGAVSPSPGSWPTTTSAGCDDSTSSRATWNPDASRLARACSYGTPSTPGTVSGFGPLDTLMRIAVPSSTCSSALMLCAVTWFTGAPELMKTTFGSSFASFSVATAASTDVPTTSGTVVIGGPVETQSVTTPVCGSTFVPSSGSCWKTKFFGCSVLGSRMSLYWRLRASSSAVAWFSCTPTSSGTATGSREASSSWIWL